MFLTIQTKQDFLHPKWVKEFRKLGVNCTDAYYYWYKIDKVNYKLITREDLLTVDDDFIIPTYTLAQLLYKLEECIIVKEDNKKHTGALGFYKNDPFYSFYYKEDAPIDSNIIESSAFYPIEAVAMLLIQCVKNKIPLNYPIDDKINGRDSFIY